MKKNHNFQEITCPVYVETDIYEMRPLLTWIVSQNSGSLKIGGQIMGLLFISPHTRCQLNCHHSMKLVGWNKTKTGPEPETPQYLVDSDESNSNLGAANRV